MDELYFPDKTSVRNFFKAFTVTEGRTEFVKVYSPKNRREGSSYCSIRTANNDYESAIAIPQDWLLDWVDENTIDVTGGLFFEMVGQTDGTYLLILAYSAIIGNRWLSYVTAPKELAR